MKPRQLEKREEGEEREPLLQQADARALLGRAAELESGGEGTRGERVGQTLSELLGAAEEAGIGREAFLRALWEREGRALPEAIKRRAARVLGGAQWVTGLFAFFSFLSGLWASAFFGLDSVASNLAALGFISAVMIFFLLAFLKERVEPSPPLSPEQDRGRLPP